MNDPELSPYWNCDDLPFMCVECGNALAVCDDSCIACQAAFYVEHPEEFESQMDFGPDLFLLSPWKQVYKQVQAARIVAWVRKRERETA